MLKSLELKVPPIIQVLLCSLFIIGTSYLINNQSIINFYPLVLSSLFFLLFLFFCISGVVEFRKSRTTVDPRDPLKSSSIVKGGVYKYTRNPMYLGMLFFLISVCFYVESYISFIYCLVFVLYMNKFQILPEEEALTEKFGSDYSLYKSNVRRWI
ncbi:MAG: protein-S-isoprenylcysteine methyltransferase [Halobacteriovoraceae bacterium]|nr:protein-S-isoprenylcysteine methyltransferase [Halobacteriovoraceae bacterium]